MHIAKTAGSSISLDVERLFGLCLPQVGWNQKCLGWLRDRTQVAPASYNGTWARPVFFTFLREPRAHVLSQFKECRFDPVWGARVTRSTSFPRSGHTWQADYEQWAKHFAGLFRMPWSSQWQRSHNATLADRDAFSCLDPRNMMVRQLACNFSYKHLNVPRKFANAGLPHALHVATSALLSLDFVGLTELYEESLCLLALRLQQQQQGSRNGSLGGFSWPLGRFVADNLPGCASALQAARTAGTMNTSACAVAVAQSSVTHDTHQVPSYTWQTANLTSATIRYVDEFTALDRALYIAGVHRFFAQISKAEHATNATILCARRRRAFLRSIAHLPDRNVQSLSLMSRLSRT